MVDLTETPQERLRVEEPETIAKAAKAQQEDIDSRDGSDRALLSNAESGDESEMFGCPKRWTPNQLRTKIRTLLQKTDIKTTEFQNVLSVNEEGPIQKKGWCEQ